MSRRKLFYMVPSLAAAVALLAAYMLEYRYGLIPCTLCLMERGLMWLVLLSACVGLLQPSGRPLGRLEPARLVTSVFAMAGMLVAGRHTWLQQFGGSAGCAPELDYMLRHWPWQKTIGMLFSSQECAIVDWSLFHLSLAAWALVAFGFMFLWLLAGPALFASKLT